MSDTDQPPAPDDLPALLRAGDRDAAAACLEQLGDADADTRRRTLRAARSVAADEPSVVDGLAGAFAGFLTDGDRSVRLTAAKLLVEAAGAAPSAVRPVVDALTERLADDDEFYYVRARCAEALGYVAQEHPGAVGDPATLADLRVGLSFDEPEVREKLAKALAYVALGDPDRLRHQVGSLADHLDDDRDLVRYHLCTALVVVGCERPAKLSEAAGALGDRLTDESPHVRGRAAEALGLLARSDHVDVSASELETAVTDGDEPSFLVDRVRFARRAITDAEAATPSSDVGTVESVRDGTDAAVDAINSPDGGEECPHCGFELAGAGPPVCPRCGAPR